MQLQLKMWPMELYLNSAGKFKVVDAGALHIAYCGTPHAFFYGIIDYAVAFLALSETPRGMNIDLPSESPRV